MEPPYVTIKLRILSLTPKDFDTYILVIYQNETQSLIFAFTIEEVDLKDTSINVAAIVSGSIADCVVVILIIAVILVRRTYEIKIKVIRRLKESGPSTKDATTYSEISMSQQENHNYEVPTRHRNVYNNVEMDTTTQYVNVNVKQDIMVSKDDSSINCNTPSENIHSPV
ncbi:uncharacterized protein LOC106053531 [Biomphalaria glabrata]|uniref:Uncharacterized protein LOC106053531 n=1 Tax=Biomphalaria glabrata TaxID=6526 RepID=A0A9W2YVR9_BIOGL|nr:uncharacterized protein LOC106053531 [Biomphalaria glabrata]